jgi:hypothetical protein
MNADNAAGRDHQSTSVTMHQQATTGILGPARRVLFMIALATFLGACGGGGDSASPASPARAAPTNSIAGVFGGSLSDDQGYDLLYVVRRDGTQVGFFGSEWSNSFKLAGYWVSYNNPARFFQHQEPTRTDTSNGLYRGESAFVSTIFDMATPRLSGLIWAGMPTTRTVAFGGGPIAGSSYKFDTPASVGAVEGRWELVDESGNAVAIDIASDGGLKGSYQGCSVAGLVKPSAGGENALIVNFDFRCGPDPQPLPLLNGFSGFAIALPMSAGGTRLLIFAQAWGEWDGPSTFVAVGQR